LLNGLLMLLACQLAGEAVARSVSLGIPGPVLGMALLALILLWRPGLDRVVAPVAGALLTNLSLLFVPAAVGVVQVLPLLAREGVAIAGALLVSTTASLIVTALTFRAVVRWRGA
jgi:holin-like protein